MELGCNLLIYIIFGFIFFIVSGKRIYVVPVFPSGPEIEVGYVFR